MVQLGNVVEKLAAGQAHGNFEKLLEVVNKNQNVRSPMLEQPPASMVVPL